MTPPARLPLLVNPTAGRGRGLATVRGLAAALPLDPHVARDPQEFSALARRLVRAGAPRLLVAGGDGAVHAAIQVLAGTDCALGVVPTGRGNDLARALGIPLRARDAAEHALRARPRRIDLGGVGDRYFAGVAALGFDGEVARFVRERAGGAAGPGVYPYAVIRTLLHFAPVGFRIRHDGGTIEAAGMLAAAANSPCYGGGMRIAPGARLDDGMLDLIFVRAVGRLRLLRLFPRVYRGAHVGHPAVVALRTARLTVAADRELTVFGDGEPLAHVGDRGTEIVVHPSALWVAA